jgi:hypothetical protein
MSISVQEHDIIMRDGQPAEARIKGVLRGGHVFEGRFYAPASVNVGVLSDALEHVTDLKLRNRDDR